MANENVSVDETKPEVPVDLFIDLAITMNKLSDKFNLNDNQLEEYDLDWHYFHKLARRSKFYAEKFGVSFD